MNYQSDCFCGGECQKPCVAIKQLQAQQKEAIEMSLVHNYEELEEECQFCDKCGEQFYHLDLLLDENGDLWCETCDKENN